jgi:glutathione S-transferase
MRTDMHLLLNAVDRELSLTPGPFFLGGDLSLIDIIYLPFLERMAASLPYYKGMEVFSTQYPALYQWFQAMDRRSTYHGIKSDYVSMFNHQGINYSLSHQWPYLILYVSLLI